LSRIYLGNYNPIKYGILVESKDEGHQLEKRDQGILSR
jgi:hypothetical protein